MTMQYSDKSETKEATRIAEASLLGSLLLNADATINDVKFIVSLDDFQYKDNRHYRIYQAMLKCEKTDEISVALKLNEMGLLLGGDCAYLCHLVAECPTSLDWEIYAKALHTYSLLRNNKKENAFKGVPL